MKKIFLCLLLITGCGGSSPEPKSADRKARDAAPEWAKLPQRLDTNQIWNSLPKEQENVEEGFLFCKFLDLPDTVWELELSAFVNKDQKYFFGQFPKEAIGTAFVPIKKNDLIQLQFSTSGIVFSYSYGSVSFVWTGKFPVEFLDRNPQLQCKALPTKDAIKIAETDLQKATELITEIEKMTFEIDSTDLGKSLTNTKIPEAISSLSAAASFLTWDDPKLIALKNKIPGLFERFNKERLKDCRKAKDWIEFDELGMRFRIDSVSSKEVEIYPMKSNETTINIQFENKSEDDVSINAFLVSSFGKMENKDMKTMTTKPDEISERISVIERNKSIQLEVVGYFSSEKVLEKYVSLSIYGEINRTGVNRNVEICL